MAKDQILGKISMLHANGTPVRLAALPSCVGVQKYRCLLVGESGQAVSTATFSARDNADALRICSEVNRHLRRETKAVA